MNSFGVIHLLFATFRSESGVLGVKEWNESGAAASKGGCPVGHRNPERAHLRADLSTWSLEMNHLEADWGG